MTDTIKVHPVIGLHLGPNKSFEETRRYLNELNNAGIPFFIKSVDDAGGFFEEAVNIARGSDVPHVLVFRLTNTPDYTYDTPPYHLDPPTAAREHWGKTLSRLPAFVKENKDIIWVETENEVDKGRADWLGHYAKAMGDIMYIDGYRHVAFG